MSVEWTSCNGFGYLDVNGLPPVCVLEVWLFYEKADIQAYLDRNSYLNFQLVLVAVGHCPDSFIIEHIQQLFQNARFRSAFGNDLPAIVLTCRISLWLKCTDALFMAQENTMFFQYKSIQFECPIPLFSLSRFCKLTGFRTRLKPMKTFR